MKPNRPKFIRHVRHTMSSSTAEFDITGFEDLSDAQLLKAAYPDLPFGGVMVSRNATRAILTEYTD